MSIQFVKPLETENILKSINNRMETAKFSYTLYELLLKNLEKFDNKPINKRIETHLKNVMPEYTFYLESLYGMYHIRFSTNGKDYNDSQSFLIGYHNNPVFTIDDFKKFNTCHFLELERLNKMQSLTIEKINGMAERWNKAINELQEVYDDASYYEIGYTSYGFDLDVRLQ